MLLFLILIIILVIVFPPIALILAGIFLYSLGNKMEKEMKKDNEISKETRMNEYDYQTLEQMK